ncbi:MAG: hypothetical protein COA79_22785 [Planctomycetota bacterium]|nr:MAG: hypothetical protein COA79_22785 [Planctomycetota bacterium]
MDNQLRRGVTELNDEQTKWRKMKCRELLKIDSAGPYMYGMDKEIPYEYVSSQVFLDYIDSLTVSSVYVLYNKGPMFRVKKWAFSKYFDDETYYCTIFDDSFDWFVLTDDNSADSDVVKIVVRL